MRRPSADAVAGNGDMPPQHYRPVHVYAPESDGLALGQVPQIDVRSEKSHRQSYCGFPRVSAAWPSILWDRWGEAL